MAKTRRHKLFTAAADTTRLKTKTNGLLTFIIISTSAAQCLKIMYFYFRIIFRNPRNRGRTFSPCIRVCIEFISYYLCHNVMLTSAGQVVKAIFVVIHIVFRYLPHFAQYYSKTFYREKTVGRLFLCKHYFLLQCCMRRRLI